MRERELLKWATDLLDRTGWKWWHVPAPMRARGKQWVPAPEAAGLPDLFCLHDDPPRLMVVELKGDRGRLTNAQRECLQAFKKVAEHSTDAYNERSSEREPTMAVFVLTPERSQMDTFERMCKSKVLA